MLFSPDMSFQPYLMFVVIGLGLGPSVEHLKDSSLRYAPVLYCIEGTEMRQLGFKVRRLLFLNRY